MPLMSCDQGEIFQGSRKSHSTIFKAQHLCCSRSRPMRVRGLKPNFSWVVARSLLILSNREFE